MADAKIQEIGCCLTECAESFRTNGKKAEDDFAACIESLIRNILAPEYEFPIDVYGILSAFGVQVVFQPVNLDENEAAKLVGVLMKHKDIVTGQERQTILIDDGANLAKRRYATAYLLGLLLMHQSEKTYRQNAWNCRHLHQKKRRSQTNLRPIC